MKFQNSAIQFYGTVHIIKPDEKILWTVLWLQIFHKKCCYKNCQIFCYFSNQFKNPILHALTAEKNWNFCFLI